MKLDTLVHRVPGYKTLPEIFLILPRDLVMGKTTFIVTPSS